MKSLAASNRHLQAPANRKAGVERNVRSSSAIEGVSAATFRSAVNGRFLTGTKDPAKTTVVKNSRSGTKK